MTQIVNALPAGVRNLLGNPLVPEPYVFHPANLTPTLDLKGFFYASSRNAQLVTAAPAVVGQTGLITVPVGQIWALYTASFNTDVLDADQAISLNGVMRVQGIGFFTPTVTVAASSRGAGTFQSGMPTEMILRGGDSWEANVATITVGAAGAVTVSTAILLSRIE